MNNELGIMGQNSNPRVYFYDPRLKMTVAGRFLVRLITYCAYAVLVVGVVTLFFSDLRELHPIGNFLALFLWDRVLDAKKGRRSLAGLPREGRDPKKTMQE